MGSYLVVNDAATCAQLYTKGQWGGILETLFSKSTIIICPLL